MHLTDVTTILDDLLGLVGLLLMFFAVAHGVVHVGIYDLTVACIVAQVHFVRVDFGLHLRVAVVQVVNGGVV